MIAGLETITSGDLYIGAAVNEVDPRDRNLAFVFQNYALFPHMTVQATSPSACASAATAGAKSRPASGRCASARHRRALARKPGELSGGQQRVARPRADPRPGRLPPRRAALEPRRQAARQHAHELIKLHRQLGRTVIHVTAIRSRR